MQHDDCERTDHPRRTRSCLDLVYTSSISHQPFAEETEANVPTRDGLMQQGHAVHLSRTQEQHRTPWLSLSLSLSLRSRAASRLCASMRCTREWRVILQREAWGSLQRALLPGNLKSHLGVPQSNPCILFQDFIIRGHTTTALRWMQHGPNDAIRANEALKLAHDSPRIHTFQNKNNIEPEKESIEGLFAASMFVFRRYT